MAVKKIKIEHSEEGIPSTAIREIALLRELKHKNIVNLIDIIHGDDGKGLYLIFEYFNQDVKKYLDLNKKPLSIPRVKSIIFQLLNGLLHCH